MSPKDLEQEGAADPPPHPKKLKYLTTIAILFGNIAFGCSFNFYSPALEDIRAKYETTVDDISIVFTIMLIAYCIGALTVGFVYIVIPRQVGVIFCLGAMALGLFLTPYCPSKTIFYVAGAIIGYGVGAYDASQIVWMIELWQEKAGPLIQAQHFCYALGSNIPPLLLGPFLSEEDEEDGGGSTTTTNAVAAAEKESKIHIPFLIGGAFATSALLCQLLLFIFCRYYTPKMYDDEMVAATAAASAGPEDEKMSSDKKGWLAFLTSTKMKLIIIIGAFLGAYQGMEMCTMQFIPTYGQYSDLKMSESDSAFVLTGLTGAFAAGRFLGIFIILKITPMILLAINLVLVLAGNVILLVWASNNLTMFWIGCVLLGLGFSTIYPSFSGFMEKNLVFSNAIGSFMIVSGSTVAAIYPLIVGNTIEEHVVTLTYTNFFSIMCCTGALFGGYWVTKGSEKRH